MHVGIAYPRWRGKRSRHSRRMRNRQFYVSGKRPMVYVSRILAYLWNVGCFDSKQTRTWQIIKMGHAQQLKLTDCVCERTKTSDEFVVVYILVFDTTFAVYILVFDIASVHKISYCLGLFPRRYMSRGSLSQFPTFRCFSQIFQHYQTTAGNYNLLGSWRLAQTTLFLSSGAVNTAHKSINTLRLGQMAAIS